MITHPDSQVTMYTDCEPQDGGGRRLPQLDHLPAYKSIHGYMLSQCMAHC